MSDSFPEDKHQAVLCDMCTDEDRKPARKTCMKCEISMCVQHLQVHLTTPVLLQTHPLTEPMAPGDAGLGGATKCPQHGKLLEYYCLDDLTSVCVACAIEDQHRLHNMKTLSTAHKELVERISAEQKALVKTAGESVSLEKWEKGERKKLAHSSVRLMEAVSSLRDIALTSVQSSVSARMVSIKTSKDSMRAAQNEKDTFRFLQMFSGVHQAVEKAKAVDLRKGLEPGEGRDKLIHELRQSGGEMLAQAHQLCGSLLILVDPENHQEAFSTIKELTFDPQTLGSGMALSKDHRRVFYGTWLGQCSAHTLLLQGTQSNIGSHRWMISLTEHCDWTVGLCDKESAKSLNDGHVYGLRCQGNHLSSLTTDYYDLEEQKSPGLQKTEKPQAEKKCRVSSQLINFPGENGEGKMSRPQKVEVFWDFASSTLSFFDRSSQYQRAEILTVKMSKNSWDLSRFVKLGEKKDQYRGAPTDFWGMERQQQELWKCTCGANYRGQCITFPQRICSCGGVVGTCIMEVLCELL